MHMAHVTNQGGLAVVTGAAHGLGAAAALAWASRGLDPVLIDLDPDALDATATRIREACPERQVQTQVCDVADGAALCAVADELAATAPVAVLMNNAGMARPSKSWEEPEAWAQILAVNLMGVLNGQMAFVPHMVRAARPAMVINTGSKQGITMPPGNPAYNVSKAGVKAMTEALAHDLRSAEVPVTAHLFVPGFVYSNMIARFVPEKPASAWTPEQTMDYLLSRLEAGDFYVLCPDNDVTPERDKARVAWAMGDMLKNRPALSRWHPDWADAFAAHERNAQDS